MDDGSPPKPASDGTRPRRMASDADHQQIDREMDEAFRWHVMRNKEVQITFQRLREAKPNASSVERKRIIEEITAKYRMLASAARSRNERVM